MSAPRPHARPLSFPMAVALVMGNMIGSGIFLLPASLAPYGGLSLVGWLVSAAGAMLLAFVFARLARGTAAAGGPYAYTRESFGDVAGFLVAWGYWNATWTSLAALAVAFVGYLTPFFPDLAAQRGAAAALALSAVWLLVGVNIAGLRTAGWVQVITTALKLVPLAVVGLAGVWHFDSTHFALPAGQGGSLLAAVPAVATLTLWAFLGLESATIPADHVEDPDRTIPRATLLGTALVAVVYVIATVGIMSLVMPSALADSTAQFADAARAVFGSWAALAVAAGAAVSCFGALNGWTLVVGQLPLAAARDGLFPSIFGRLSAHGTPAAGLAIAGVLTTGLVLLNYTRGLVELFTFFILLATLNTLVPYAFCAVAVFLAPGRARVTRLTSGAGIAAALAFVYSLWAMGGAGHETVYWGFLLLMTGLPVYVLIARNP